MTPLDRFAWWASKPTNLIKLFAAWAIIGVVLCALLPEFRP